MKKFFLFIIIPFFIACSDDDSDNNSASYENALIIGGQEYPLAKGVLQFFNSEDGTANEYECYLVFGDSSMPNNIFLSDSDDSYEGLVIDIGFISENPDGVGNFSGEDVGAEYDLTSGDGDESFVTCGYDLSTTQLSVSKSGNNYSIEFNSIDENGSVVEVHFNGGISVVDAN